jgi:phage shock protein PspC (stress-responsive transcriptional regulator)
MLGGVCGGLGEYFEFDPVLVRVIFVAAAFVTGVGLIAYLLLWIIVPFEPVGPIITPEPVSTNAAQNSQQFTQTQVTPRKNGGSVFGIILIVIGCIFLADNFLPFFHFWHFWPLILIAIGAALLLKAPKN